MITQYRVQCKVQLATIITPHGSAQLLTNTPGERRAKSVVFHPPSRSYDLVFESLMDKVAGWSVLRV